MDDGTLQRARRGDPAAVDAVLEELAPVLARYGRAMCKHDADAEDVLQDALLLVAQNLPSYEGRSSLATWAYTLARTACTRRRRGMKNRPFAPEDRATAVADEAPDPERNAVDRQLGERLRDALREIPEDYREVLVLREVEGLSAADTAEVLGTSVDAVKSRLHRARASLRDAFFRQTAEPLPPPGKDCPDAVQMLSRHLEGELDGDTCARMEAHVSTCRACGPACKSLREVLAVCKSVPGPVPSDLAASVRRAVRAWRNPPTA